MFVVPIVPNVQNRLLNKILKKLINIKVRASRISTHKSLDRLGHTSLRTCPWNPNKDNIIAAANDKCFDAAILAAFISRQTRGGSDLDGTDGWIPCHNDPYQKCFGIMHMSQGKF